MTALKVKKLIPTHLGEGAEYIKLETPADAKALIEKTINWTLRGQIAPGVATPVTNAILAFTRLVEAVEIEAKLNEIQKRLLGHEQNYRQAG